MSRTGNGAWSIRDTPRTDAHWVKVAESAKDHGGWDSWQPEMMRLFAQELERELAEEHRQYKAEVAKCDGMSHQLVLAQEEIERLGKCLSDSTTWIPLAERVPTEEGRYAILYRYKDTGIVKAFIGDFLGDGWSCDVRDSTITHWMPLPEALK